MYSIKISLLYDPVTEITPKLKKEFRIFKF